MTYSIRIFTEWLHKLPWWAVQHYNTNAIPPYGPGNPCYQKGWK